MKTGQYLPLGNEYGITPQVALSKWTPTESNSAGSTTSPQALQATGHCNEALNNEKGREHGWPWQLQKGLQKRGRTLGAEGPRPKALLAYNY